MHHNGPLPQVVGGGKKQTWTCDELVSTSSWIWAWCWIWKFRAGMWDLEKKKNSQVQLELEHDSLLMILSGLTFVMYHLNIQLTLTFSDLLQHFLTFSDIPISLLFYFTKSNSDRLFLAFWTSSILIILRPLGAIVSDSAVFCTLLILPQCYF